MSGDRNQPEPIHDGRCQWCNGSAEGDDSTLVFTARGYWWHRDERRSYLVTCVDELHERAEEAEWHVAELRAQVQAAEKKALIEASERLDVEKNGIAPESYYMTNWAIRWLRARAAALVPTNQRRDQRSIDMSNDDENA